jgi:mycothiol synthase
LVDAFDLRSFDPSRDAAAWVALNALAFADHPEQGQLSLQDLEQRIAQPWFDPSGLILAVTPGAAGTGGVAGSGGGAGTGGAASGADVERNDQSTERGVARRASAWPSGGELMGYVWTKIEGGRGEIYAIGVHPAAQGRRLGTRLLRAALHQMEDRGVREVRLFVEADNTPAIAAYRRQGFQLTRRDVQYAFAPAAAASG